ncbi:sugar phosphate isomerase/epimerase family protein [Alicyclobacillus kakegawensis]|uniref:sugar phosphate isomerase/epimerase family protein n=1 Tax=Alicyclobacillus kakegawensis TaxID=392012 RepID=UPI00082B0C47|nr:sugar phosphate isomerase/epimerase family protein [Alicyclobacillus kakegawensis]
MKIGLNQWCFGDWVGLAHVFAACQRAGVDGVELNLQEAGGDELTMDSTPSDVREIARRAHAAGLELKSLATGLLWNFPLSAPQPEVRQKARTIVHRQLEIASWLEMDAVLVVPGVVTAEVPYDECYERSLAELEALAGEAQRRGVKIAIENVWNKFLLSPLEMKAYVDTIGSAWVGVYLDVGNVLAFGFPEQWIRILGPRICKVHVKDYAQSVGNIHGFVPLWAGDVNWPQVLEALRGIGYDDYLTAECTPYRYGGTQVADDVARQLRRILQL